MKVPTRWAWAPPALVAGTVTAALLLVLGLLTGGDDAGLPRQRIATPAPAAATPSALAGGAPLVLRADGLGLVDFGQPAADVTATLIQRLGLPDENAAQPCEKNPSAQSRWLRWADLSVRMDEHAFAAYIEGVHFPPGRAAFDFATAQGLSPGDPAQRLHSIYRGSVTGRAAPTVPGRAPTETFTIPSTPRGSALSGVIEPPGPAGVVVAIFAGEFC